MVETLNILILCIIGYSLVFSLVKKEKILWALFLIGFTQIGDIYPILGTIRIELMVGIISLIYIFFAGDKLSYLSFKKSLINKYFYLFVIVATLSAIFAMDRTEAFYWIEFYFKRCWILFFLAALFIDDENGLRRFTIIFTIAVTWISLYAVINYVTGSSVVEVNGVLRVRGATGILNNPNGLANTIVQTIPFIFYLSQSIKKKLFKILIYGLLCFAILAIFLSGSRGGFYGLIACIFLMACYSRRKKMAFAFGSILIIIALSIAGTNLVDRYATILDPGNMGKSGDARIWGLRHGINMLIRRPLLGVGLGNYHIARQRWFGWRLWAHNHYGQLFGELGLLGIITWGGTIYYTLNTSRRIRLKIKENYEDENNNRCYLYYFCIAVETATYSRLILGMSTHSMHIFFWYLNAGMMVSCMRIAERDLKLFDNGKKNT